MARSRKNLKSHRRRVKKSSKRRGGQLTPLSDISTNSSLHDLDDYDEPSNNTTSESIISDRVTTSTASGQVTANLLGQFNAAADEDTIESTNNTTAASDASSENSFSNVATSFGDLGHGGKRRRTRKSKKSRKSRKSRRR